MKNKINSKINFIVCPKCKKKYPKGTLGRLVWVYKDDVCKIKAFRISVCEICYKLIKLKE